MAVSGDLNAQNYSTFQSAAQPLPVTIASAATIAPTTKLTFLTGTTQVVTITPPTTGYCELTLCFTNASPGAFSVAGNIQIAYQPIQNRPIDLCFDPSSNKWWVKAVV
jgi:hypothetical protein